MQFVLFCFFFKSKKTSHAFGFPRFFGDDKNDQDRQMKLFWSRIQATPVFLSRKKFKKHPLQE